MREWMSEATTVLATSCDVVTAGGNEQSSTNVGDIMSESQTVKVKGHPKSFNPISEGHNSSSNVYI